LGQDRAVWVAYPKRKAIVLFALAAGRIHAGEASARSSAAINAFLNRPIPAWLRCPT